MHKLGSIIVMRLDQTRNVACASSCMSMRTSLEEGIKLHRFTAIFPKQLLTETGRHRKAVVASDQRMVIRCFGDDLAGFVHDISHAASDQSDTDGSRNPGYSMMVDLLGLPAPSLVAVERRR
jgi:hypothetical protein